MGDAWDDSDDDWDQSDDEDELDKKLGLMTTKDDAPPAFDDEEDLAVTEKASVAKTTHQTLKVKGQKLADKKRAEEERKEEEELARKAMEMEAELEENMDDDERRRREQERIEEDAQAQADDLFGGVDAPMGGAIAGPAGKAMQAGDTVKLKDLKDHLKHARKVAQCLKGHGKIHLATAFLKECMQESKDVLDDDAITDLIKTMNIIKNEKVQAAKRKVKGQAQKAAKRDKKAEAKAKKLQDELYGDSNQFDDYDEVGEAYEDAFF
uniref:Eukaryotic translation initiation factor 3 30 kDa subunit n=1 Tax=Trieres chinensis TaxID=1514140 RepID=A0A7S1ZA49_TRICV